MGAGTLHIEGDEMHIKFKTTSSSPHGSFNAGQIAEVDDAFARSLIDGGYAEDATPSTPEPVEKPINLPDGTVAHVEIDGQFFKGHFEGGEFIQDEDEPADPPVADPPVADPPVVDPPATSKPRR